MNRARITIRALRWRLLLAAPVLLLVAITVNWAPFYLAFIADVCAVVYAFRRVAPQRR